MKPDPPINIEDRVDIVDRLRMAHANVSMPWRPSLYSIAADVIEQLRTERTNP